VGAHRGGDASRRTLHALFPKPIFALALPTSPGNAGQVCPMAYARGAVSREGVDSKLT